MYSLRATNRLSAGPALGLGPPWGTISSSSRRVRTPTCGASSHSSGALATTHHSFRRLATTHHSFLGSFSSVSKRNFASKYAFCSIFQNLQNYLAEFSKSCKISQQISDFWQKSGNIPKKCKINYFCKILLKFVKICQNLSKFVKILKIQLENFVDFEKCCKMPIWMQKFVSIQTRTGLKKSDVSWAHRVQKKSIAQSAGRGGRGSAAHDRCGGQARCGRSQAAGRPWPRRALGLQRRHRP